ncbi:MAG TPA: hypothetical protein V6C88_13940, partial [Chroococcidiopsis sp.]
MNIYVNQKRLKLRAGQAIASGGEADIFDIGGGLVLKLFKQADHADYQGLPLEQQGARDRLAQHQRKLRQFPVGLPSRVVAPVALATDRGGQVVGYTMPLIAGADVLLRYGDRHFRQAGVGPQTVVRVFQDLHETVVALHGRGVVIGDFNDLNVLVKGTAAYLIDADSFQFDGFLCSVFTARFADPLLCDPQANRPILLYPHSPESDWYAFAVLLMQCLLYVDPYGGVYKPKSTSRRIPQAARSLHRITVFHPEVLYPKPAIPYGVLPDELLHYFHQVFERDQRGVLPRSLLDSLQWQRCGQCGADHARTVCPFCTVTVGMATVGTVTGALAGSGRLSGGQAAVRVQGAVTATQVFYTEGVIVMATMAGGRLRWLYHDQGQFKREDGTAILNGDRHPHLRWRILGDDTLLGYQGQVVRLNNKDNTQSNIQSDRLAVDSRGNTALFEVNGGALYWVEQGQLRRQRAGNAGDTGGMAAYLGDVLPGQTYLWLGAEFGLGLYRAGNLNVAFIVDGQRSRLDDHLQIPPWQGQLVDATCALSTEYAWLFLTTQEQGQLRDRCVVVRRDGAVMAMTVATEGDGSWLATLGNGRSRADPCPYLA